MVGRQRAQENNSVKSIHFPVNVVFLGIVSACACEGTEVPAPVQSCQFGPVWAGETELWLAVTLVLSSKGIKSCFLSVKLFSAWCKGLRFLPNSGLTGYGLCT